MGNTADGRANRKILWDGVSGVPGGEAGILSPPPYAMWCLTQ